jgi:glucan phosphoethanolaminetransferase (alkaline phosphatase superfamily)
MNYRKANDDEHNIICKQVRSQSVLTVCLSAPIIPVAILAACLSVNMMIRQRYDKATFVISTLVMVLFVIVVAAIMISLTSGFIKRISSINKRNYSVADCVVAGRSQTINPKHNHSFVTVSFPDGTTQQAMVSQKVYDLAENGKRALLIKYDEPEGKEKLPFEIAVL